jgi:hypothetical protein
VLIQKAYPSAETTHTYLWERWKRENSERDLAVEALFDRRFTLLTPDGSDARFACLQVAS